MFGERMKNLTWRMREHLSSQDVPDPHPLESATALSDEQSRQLGALLTQLETWSEKNPDRSITEVVDDATFQEGSDSLVGSLCAEWNTSSPGEQKKTSPSDRFLLGVRELRPALKMYGKGYAEIRDMPTIRQWWEFIKAAAAKHANAAPLHE